MSFRTRTLENNTEDDDCILIEKQILRDLAAVIKYHLARIKTQPGTMLLSAVSRGVEEIQKAADSLEKLSQ